jgi:hypothetical protein
MKSLLVLLVSPFAFKTIDLIITSILSIYKENHAVIEALWMAINYCTQLEEVLYKFFLK